MPSIPPLSLTSDSVNVQEIYANGLFDPTQATPQTLEILNGGLDDVNAAVAADYVPTWAIQPGALVSGVYMPFDRWEYVYGSQLSGGLSGGGSDVDLAVNVAGLSARIFKPWDVNFLMFGYQAFFQHDARAVSEGTDVSQNELEYWSVLFSCGGQRITGMNAFLPYGAYQEPRNSEGTFMSEYRWRFVSKTHAFKRGVVSDDIMDKGYLNLHVGLWANLLEDDQWKCKCKIPTGGIWVMAFR